MKLHIIGCSGSIPSPFSPSSCYVLEAEQTDATVRVAMDLGLGSSGPLQRISALDELDAVAFSHLHGDHCGDFWSLYVVLRHFGGGTAPRLPIYGPAGAPARFAAMIDTPEEELHEYFDFHQWSAGEPVMVGPLRITPYPAQHPVPAFSLRVEDTSGGNAAGVSEQGNALGIESLAYSGDTDDCDGLRAAANGVQTFLCEVSFTEDLSANAGVHLTGKRAGTVASECAVGRLLLTHVPPHIDKRVIAREVAGAFAGQFDFVAPGLTYDT